MARKHINFGTKLIDKNTVEYLRNTAVKPQSPKSMPKIGHIDGMIYEDHGMLNRDAMRDIVEMNKESILAEYMKPYLSVPYISYASHSAKDSKSSLMGVDSSIRDIIRLVKQVSDVNPKKVRIRAEDTKNIFYLTIRSRDDRVDERQLWCTQFNKERCVVQSYVIGVNLKERTIFPISLTSVYAGKREKDAIAELQRTHETNHMIVCIDPNHNSDPSRFSYYDWLQIDMMIHIMRTFVLCPEMSRIEVTEPVHHYVEMYFFEKLRRETTGNIQAFFVYSAFNSHTSSGPDLVWNSLNETVSSEGRGDIEEAEEDLEIPLVDFTPKEEQFISKYISDKGYFGNGDQEVDLIEKLSHPRYGYNLRIPVRKEDGTVETFLMSYVIDEEKELMRVYAFITNDAGIRSVMISDFEDIRHFSGEKNFSGIHAGIAIKREAPLMDRMETIKANMPDCFLSIDSSIMLVYEMLSIHIIIYDRPQRTRMVRCQEARASTSKKKSGKPAEPDYLVRRILKPVKEAKELIRLSQEVDPGAPIQREYTMEEWERVGHWRHLPGSEKSIWIEKTTCRRQLPLSDKEIHIKL